MHSRQIWCPEPASRMQLVAPAGSARAPRGLPVLLRRGPVHTPLLPAGGVEAAAVQRAMADEGFASLDEAAVAGAHGLGWGPPSPLLSPVDILSIDDFLAIDVFEKPGGGGGGGMQQAPVDAAALRDALAGSAPRGPAGVGVVPAAPAVLAADAKPPRVRAARPRRGAVRKKGAPRKASRANEVVEYGPLADIAGTTAARSRQMNEEERRVMLHKRRLRNRASAARSREKRCRTITELGKEISGLLDRSNGLAQECADVQRENGELRAQNAALQKRVAELVAEKTAWEKDNLMMRNMS